MEVKSVLGVIPGGVLVAGGCAVFLYTRLKYEPTASEFKDFGQLKYHLLNCDNHKSNVIIEGTVTKLAENSVRSKNAGIEGAARKVLATVQGKSSTVSNISVPFLLVDSNGRSVRVTAVHQALRISLVMEKVWEDAGSGRPNIPATREQMLTFGTRLGIFGCAILSKADEITLAPEEADESMAVTSSSRKSRRRLLYAGGWLLVLSGCAVLAINFANPLFKCRG